MTNPEKLPSLQELGARIAKAKQEDFPEEHPQDGETASEEIGGLRVGMELMAGVGVGSLIGYFLDKWLHTSPLFLIVMFFIGAAAGYLNIYRLATGKDKEK